MEGAQLSTQVMYHLNTDNNYVYSSKITLSSISMYCMPFVTYILIQTRYATTQFKINFKISEFYLIEKITKLIMIELQRFSIIEIILLLR